MAWVFAAPEYVAAAASDLASIASMLGTANSAAAFPTSGVLAAGGDDVSAAIAAMFNAHAQAYQALSAQAAQFHQQFVELMSGGASQYASAEAANATPMQPGAAFSTDSNVGPGGSRLTGDGAPGASGQSSAASPAASDGHLGAAGASGLVSGSGAAGAINGGALSAQSVGSGGETAIVSEGGSGGPGVDDAVGFGGEDSSSFYGGSGVAAPTPFLLNSLGSGAPGAGASSSNNNGSAATAGGAAVPVEAVAEYTPGIGSLGGDEGFLSGFGSSHADGGSLYGSGAAEGASFRGDPGAAGASGTPAPAQP